MNYVRVGNSGLKITEITYGSALTIGTEHTDQEYSDLMIETAWNLGIRAFDTSNNYGYGKAEILLGESLKKYPREEFVLSAKGSWPIGDTPYHKGLSKKHIFWAFENTLKNLQMDYVDIYYAHRFDPEVNLEEVARTFNDLIRSGKARYWATSEWPVEALKELSQVCDKLMLEKPIAEQFIYSYALTKAEKNGVKEFCDKNQFGTLGFSPLCQGFLTGKYKNGIPENSRISKAKQLNYDKTINFYNQNKDTIDFFLSVCEKYSVDYTAVALQWCLRKKIYPVMGASRPDQLENNVKALDIHVPNELWIELENFKLDK